MIARKINYNNSKSSLQAYASAKKRSIDTPAFRRNSIKQVEYRLLEHLSPSEHDYVLGQTLGLDVKLALKNGKLTCLKRNSDNSYVSFRPLVNSGDLIYLSKYIQKCRVYNTSKGPMVEVRVMLGERKGVGKDYTKARALAQAVFKAADVRRIPKKDLIPEKIE